MASDCYNSDFPTEDNVNLKVDFQAEIRKKFKRAVRRLVRLNREATKLGI